MIKKKLLNAIEEVQAVRVLGSELGVESPCAAPEQQRERQPLVAEALLRGGGERVDACA